MKAMKRTLAALLCLAMVLTGICWVQTDGSEAKAEAETTSVNKDMLDVKVQVATNDTNDTNIMRFVSSVDSLDYAETGFEVTPEGATAKTYSTNVVYERIKSTTNGVEYKFSPKVVDTSSEYFVTAKMEVDADANYTVRAFVKTFAGETIYGEIRCVTMSDGTATDTINMSFKAATAPTVGSKIDVTYKATADAEEETKTTAEVIAVKETGVAVRVAASASSLPSATEFTFGDYGSEIYRNLYTEYKGTGTDDQTWYDVYLADDLKETEFTIATNADLYGFMNMYKDGNLFAGKTLYVISDIAMNDNVTDEVVESWAAGTTTPDYQWIPSGNDSSGTRFQGTFDGQMHTLSGFYVNEDQTYAGMFGSIDLRAVVKNFYLTDSYMYTTGGPLDDSGIMYSYLGSVTGENRGTVENIYSDAIVASDGQRVGGIVGVHNTTLAVAEAGLQAVINNCWFDGEVRMLEETGICGGGIAGLVQQRECTMQNLLFTGKIIYENTGTDSMYIGGIMGNENNSSSIVNMEECVSAGTIEKTTNTTSVGSALGGAKNNAAVYRMVNVYAVSDMGTLVGSGTADYPGMSIAKESLYGTTAYKKTLLDLEEVWGARENDIPVLRTFDEKYDAKDIVTDFSGLERNEWYNASTKGYGLRTATSLYMLGELTKESSLTGMLVYLMEDIDLNPGWTAPKNGTEEVTGDPQVFTTIGNYGSNKYTFGGVFDGRGHTISGMYINSSVSEQAGMFGRCSSGTVLKNFVITNSYMRHSGDHWSGSVVGCAMGCTMSNIYSDMVIKTNAQQVGGLAGRFEGTVTSCWYNGEIYALKADSSKVTDSYGIGGLVGAVGQSSSCKYLTITDCLYSGEIILSSVTSASTRIGVGGILGDRRNTTQTITLENCIVSGTIDTKASGGVGAFIGALYSNASGVHVVDKCYAREDVVINSTNTSLIGAIAASGDGSTVATSSLVANSALVGSQIYDNTSIDLDYTAWVARKNDTVIPSVFAGWIVPESEVVTQ